MVTSLAEGLDALRRGREEVVIAGELGGEIRLVVVVRERRVRRGGMLEDAECSFQEGDIIYQNGKGLVEDLELIERDKDGLKSRCE